MITDQRLQIAALAGLAVVSALIATQEPTAGRALVGIFGFALFIQVALANRRNALFLILVFLVLLGFVRRILIPLAGWAENDPLLLVSPAAAVTLWYLGRDRRAARGFMAGAVTVLLLWCIAQVMNPFEPDLVQSAQSLLFYITPFLWFFVGRTFERDTHQLVLRVFQWMAIPVVALGLYHSFGRFFPFELTWIGVSGQSAAIFLEGFHIRPFSTLTSPQEYGYYLSFAIVLLWARLLHRPRHPLIVTGALLVTMAALFLQASRSIFAMMLLALAVTALVHFRSAMALFTVTSVVVLILAYALTADRAEPVSSREARQQSTIQTLIQHELAGLTDPSSSTAPLHVDLVLTGLGEGLRQPLGLGVSHGSIARFKNEPSATFGSESDIGNVAAGLGVFAGVVLILFIVVTLWTTLRLEAVDPSLLHLTVLGIAIASFGQWATGALYCTSTFLWFLLGGISREAAADLVGRDPSRSQLDLVATTHTL